MNLTLLEHFIVLFAVWFGLNIYFKYYTLKTMVFYSAGVSLVSYFIHPDAGMSFDSLIAWIIPAVMFYFVFNYLIKLPRNPSPPRHT